MLAPSKGAIRPCRIDDDGHVYEMDGTPIEGFDPGRVKKGLADAEAGRTRPLRDITADRNGFTLTELLIVVSIILFVSALALPTVLSMAQGQQAVAAAQLLQGALMQAQSEAMRASSRRGGEANTTQSDAETLRGIRLVPERVTRLADGTIDPAAPLVSSALTPLTIPPAYQDGRVSIYPGWAYPAAVTGGRPCLVLEESPGHWEPAGGGYAWIPNPPTSWAWNLRAGEKVSFGPGDEYVICGPIVVDNPEQFINYGPAGTAPGFGRAYVPPDGPGRSDAEPEILLLVNGRDDDLDGYADNGWDGLDNDGDGGVDELDEWIERETWLMHESRGTVDSAYRVIRRAVPDDGPRGLALPSGVVIDLAGWDSGAGRSRLVVDRHDGAVNLMLDKTGKFRYDSPYSGTSAVGMGRDSYAHFWIGSRADIVDAASPIMPPKEDARLLTIDRAGLVSVLTVNPDDPERTYLDARRGAR